MAMAPSGKPAGPLGRHYRLMWDINHTFESTFHPPMTPETVELAQFGEFSGRAVDAYVAGIGPDAGYVTAFKSQKTRMEYLVDRYERGAALGDLRYFNHAENLKQSSAGRPRSSRHPGRGSPAHRGRSLVPDQHERLAPRRHKQR